MARENLRALLRDALRTKSFCEAAEKALRRPGAAAQLREPGASADDVKAEHGYQVGGASLRQLRPLRNNDRSTVGRHDGARVARAEA